MARPRLIYFSSRSRYCRVNPIKRHERAATHDDAAYGGRDEWVLRPFHLLLASTRRNVSFSTNGELRTIKGFRWSGSWKNVVSTSCCLPAAGPQTNGAGIFSFITGPERFTSRKPPLIGRSRFFFFFLLDQQTCSGVSQLSHPSLPFLIQFRQKSAFSGYFAPGLPLPRNNRPGQFRFNQVNPILFSTNIYTYIRKSSENGI